MSRLIEFVPVEHVPSPGEIVSASDSWIEAAGRLRCADAAFKKLADSVLFFTPGTTRRVRSGRQAELEARDRGACDCARAPAAPWVAFVDEVGERTIPTIGPKREPRGHDDSLPCRALGLRRRLLLRGRHRRPRCRAPMRASLSRLRGLGTLQRGPVELDALVGSGKDEAELYQPGVLGLLLGSWSTSGPLGGWAQPGGPFTAAPAPVPRADSTAPATASSPVSLSRWRPTPRPRTRSRLRPAAAPGPSPARASRRARPRSDRHLRMNWR